MAMEDEIHTHLALLGRENKAAGNQTVYPTPHSQGAPGAP